jgi:hypothetical protein
VLDYAVDEIDGGDDGADLNNEHDRVFVKNPWIKFAEGFENGAANQSG